MDDSLLSEFEQLKISAFSKYKLLKCGTDQITLGPRSIQNETHQLALENVQNKNITKKDIQSFADNDIHEILIKNEMQRNNSVQNKVQLRMENIENFSKTNQMSHKNKWLLAQEEFIKCQRQKELKILEANDEFDRNISHEHARNEKLYQEMEEKRKRREFELKQAEERKKMLFQNIEKITKDLQEFQNVYQSITITINKCLNKETLNEQFKEHYELLKQLANQIEEITFKCKQSTVNEEDVRKCSEILVKIKGLNIKLTEIVDEINSNKKASSQQVVPPVISEPSTIVNQTIVTQESKIEIQEKVNNKSLSTEIFSMTKYVSLNNFKFYCEIINFLEIHTKSFQELKEDASLKQFKFDCKKAVNIPVNALSGITSDHILDKYDRLHNLLKGDNVVVNNKMINASKHPQGIAFCMDLLAKKLVLQGDLMVSGNPESAFCYSSLIASLWNEFPSFGQLILAYFYKSCPGLVPYYIPREVDESDEEFYKKCGYQYTEGQIETQDKFLKRITGITRLYFALLIVKPKRSQKQAPHNLCHGWKWLSSILKLEPQVDITATMLHTFLETVGFEMEAKYGKMFLKTLQIIKGKFLQICKHRCTGGAGTRLELLLNEYMKKRKFLQPSGYTAVSLW